MKFRYLISPFICVSLLSCGGKGGLEMFAPPRIKNPNELKTEAISDELALGVDAMGAAGATRRFESNFEQGDIEDIHANVVFAPEDVNVKFDIVKIASAENSVTWTKNYRKAIQRSRIEGLPLLIWFTDSKGSVISNRLSQELFARGDFDTWVRENYSTLLVDKATESSDDSDDMKVRKKRYYEGMISRFGVKGTPEVLVLDAKGDVFARYRGYTKGDADFYWGRLKVAQVTAATSYGSWREKKEKQGFRMWHSIEGNGKVFAKMIGKTDEEVQLTTPEGQTFTQAKTRFSQQDRDWIEKNKPKS